MVGGYGIVEFNRHVKADKSVSAASGRQDCADQSGISRNLNVCQRDNVEQMRQAMQEVYRRCGAGYSHHYGKEWQLLDIDMSGMPAGCQGIGDGKGYFAKKKINAVANLGRIYATLNDENVSERLYRGEYPVVNRNMLTLVTDAETILNLNPGFR